MRKLLVLGIHTIAYSEATGIVHHIVCVECEDVALALNNLKRLNREYIVAAILVCCNCYKLDTDCIVEALLVNIECDAVFVTCVDCTCVNI